MTKVRRICL